MAHRIRTRPRNGPGAKLEKVHKSMYVLRVWDPAKRRWAWWGWRLSSENDGPVSDVRQTTQFWSRSAALMEAKRVSDAGWKSIRIVPLNLMAEWIEDKEP